MLGNLHTLLMQMARHEVETHNAVIPSSFPIPVRRITDVQQPQREEIITNEPSTFATSIQTLQFQTAMCVNLGYMSASKQQPGYPASTEGRVQTCQVKKGMSPSCKHFLSGRERFLNPGATKPFLFLIQTTADVGLRS